MTIILKALICFITFHWAFGGYTPITRQYGKLNPFFNQTSWGFLRQVVGNREVSRVPSTWLQDDVNKRLRMDVGKRGEPGFMAEFYFLKDRTYEVRPTPNGGYSCTMMPDFNYTTEISTYGEPNYGFYGRHVLQEYNGVAGDAYAGQAVDGVGQLNCIFYCDSETCTKFLRLLIIGSANKFSYLDYWFGDNLTTTIPPSYMYTVPAECNRQPKVCEKAFTSIVL